MAVNANVHWPKLTDDLNGPRHPRKCQSCGAEPKPYAMPLVAIFGWQHLIYWRECDDLDNATGAYLVLCKACSDRLIENHPRLYEAVNPMETEPGIMNLCVTCRHRAGVRCTEREVRRDPKRFIWSTTTPIKIHFCGPEGCEADMHDGSLNGPEVCTMHEPREEGE